MATSLVFNPPVIAHRGASAYAPENTMASFIKAAQLGIKWVEFDVMQAATGDTVIFHDELLDRTSNERGRVNDFSLAYLQSLDVGGWFDSRFSGERIPTLVPVIHFLQEANMSANIEIKAFPGHEKKLVERVLDEMNPFLTRANNQFIFSSFSLTALRILRGYSPGCQIGFLMHEWRKDWEEECQALHCVSVHVNKYILTKERAQKIKSMDKALLCYTVNDPIKANKFFSWGVDAVFSDKPDKIIYPSPDASCATGLIGNILNRADR